MYKNCFNRKFGYHINIQNQVINMKSSNKISGQQKMLLTAHRQWNMHIKTI